MEIHNCWGVIGWRSGKSRYTWLLTCIAYPEFLLRFVTLPNHFNCVFSLFNWVNTQLRLLIKVLGGVVLTTAKSTLTRENLILKCWPV